MSGRDVKAWGGADFPDGLETHGGSPVNPAPLSPYTTERPGLRSIFKRSRKGLAEFIRPKAPIRFSVERKPEDGGEYLHFFFSQHPRWSEKNN